MNPGQIKALMARLNPTLTRALEAAAGACIQRTHYEITIEHCLVQLLDQSSSDVHLCLVKSGIDVQSARTELEKSLARLHTGNGAKPRFSMILLESLTSAWNLGNLELGHERLRSIHLLIALLRDQNWLASSPYQFLARLSESFVLEQAKELTLGSEEQSGQPAAPTAAKGTPAAVSEALAAYTVDLVAQARAGGIDPVIGRDLEIHQVVDILSRRRKNNPILVGEPGVGKSAIVEGLALMIAEDKAPPALAGTAILTLDLGLLKAGASMKGEFEERIKQVIEAVKNSATPIVLFIDEAHTLIGAGGAAGSGDAANLLKPALARGSLRTIAATTWSEYKKYIEKDPALERRFQVVKVDEPSAALAASMMRGLKHKYAAHHGVVILDSAVEAAASLGDRYISGRQLPDKAIDLLDTACARVRLSLDSPPYEMVQLESQLVHLALEIEEKESEVKITGVPIAALEDLRERHAAVQVEAEALRARWQHERELVLKLIACESAETPDPETRAALQAELEQAGGENPLISYRVTGQTVAAIVSQWTGIPVGRMIKDTLADILELDKKLQARVLGQDHAGARIARAIQVSKASVNNPDTPIGAFLCVGPSGTGKTEMALTLADQLFGGERFLIQINMSEYQEKHTLSRLIGSPPGYVGYGEGGVLTEAVRQRPYSVVLLDEVEKGHPDVMNLFYQVFDKGHCADGEGRIIDFKNTVVMMTSNLGSAITEDLCSQEPWPEIDEVLEAIRPELNRYFKPALLARMTVIPYYPISDKVMKRIIGLKLRKIALRLKGKHGIAMSADAAFLDKIAERCRLVEAGARNIDHILNGELLPQIAESILRFLLEGTMPTSLRVGLKEERFVLEFNP